MTADREALVRAVTDEVVRQLAALPRTGFRAAEEGVRTGDGLERDASGVPVVPCNISNRHLHVSAADLDALFGKGHALTRMKDLMQPGQFACEEIVTVATQRGRCTERVRILGPARPRTQLEISRTDAYFLGLRPPVRNSGDLRGSAGCTLIGPAGTVILEEGVIIANRHLHCPAELAAELSLRDGQMVRARAAHADKPTIFESVTVRVATPARWELHLDLDDANAAGVLNGDRVQLLIE